MKNVQVKDLRKGDVLTSGDAQAPAAEGWSYRHKFGIISVKGWGDPFIVVTEDKFFDGASWGYSYYRLGVSFPNEEEAKKAAEALNFTSNLPRIFSPEESQTFLLRVQSDFPEAEIAKK